MGDEAERDNHKFLPQLYKSSALRQKAHAKPAGDGKVTDGRHLKHNSMIPDDLY